jgi:hypothetical protein
MSLSRDPAARPPVGVASPDRDGRRGLPAGAPLALPAPLPVPVRTPAIPDPARPPAPVERRLPEHQGKLARINGALAGLSEDLRAWVELRVELVRAELLEKVEFTKGQVIQKAAAGLFAVLGALFLLVTLALGLGWWLGHPFWGFLIVTLLLFLVAAVAYAALKPKPPSTLVPEQLP